MNLKILVVDDSLLFRKVLRDLLKRIPGVEAVGFVPNGRIGLSRAKELQPDLITLDIQMPDMNGLQFIEELRKDGCHAGVILLSEASKSGSRLTMKALEMGAFDFIPKPSCADFNEECTEAFFSRFSPVVRTFASRLEIRSILGSPPVKGKRADAPDVETPPEKPSGSRVPATPQKPLGKADLIVIGISTGGPKALHSIFSAISSPLPVPILIVQHIPAYFSKPLAESLREKSGLPIFEAQDGDLLEPGKILIAPGGKQMKVRRDSSSGRLKVRVTDEPPEANCKPCIDSLLRSVSESEVGKVAVFIMTGMGSDGAKGAGLVKAAGGMVFAQDAETSTVFGMPRVVIESGFADQVVPLDLIPGKIRQLAGGE